MRWKITIGCLLLLSGVVVFVYAATRNAADLRVFDEMHSEFRTMFWDDNAPISVHHEHKELFYPIRHLMFEMLYGLDGGDCWETEALAVCFVGVVLVFLGIVSIRSDVLKRCVLAGSQTADIAAVRAAGNAVFLFRIVFLFCLATAFIVVGHNSCRYWSHFLFGTFPHLTELALRCVDLVRYRWWLAAPVLLALIFLDRFLYMRVLKSERRRWRWLWEMPIDWCLGIVFLSLFFWVLYMPFVPSREYRINNTVALELICPSEEAEAVTAQIKDIIQKANRHYSIMRRKFSREEALAIPEWPEWKDWVKAHKNGLPEQMTIVTVRCRKKDKSACERLLRDYADHYNESLKAVTRDKTMDGDKK
jgi:hypothetical protein